MDWTDRTQWTDLRRERTVWRGESGEHQRGSLTLLSPSGSETLAFRRGWFGNFLKTPDLYERWVEDCPLAYRSNNAPKKRNVLGTLFLSILSGHWRYAHMTSIRYDTVNPGLLGMSQVVSEDSVRRAFLPMEEETCAKWLVQQNDASKSRSATSAEVSVNAQLPFLG